MQLLDDPIAQPTGTVPCFFFTGPLFKEREARRSAARAGRGACVALRRPFDLLEPGFAPVGEDRPRAEAVVVAGADDVLEDDAVRLEVEHLAVGLLDQTVHPRADPSRTPAVVAHLVVEAEAAVVVRGVERGLDRFPALDPHEIAGLEVELHDRRRALLELPLD